VGSLLGTLLAATAALYTLSAISHLLCVFRHGYEAVARCATRVSWAAHSTTLVLLLAYTGRMPVYTRFEFAFLFTWFLVGVHVLIEVLRENQTAGPFLLPLIAVLQVAGVAQWGAAHESLGLHHLPGSLVGWHVGVMLLGYGFLAASFVSAGLYLLQERNLRVKRWGPIYYRLPSLESLDLWGGRFVYVGFLLLTIGMAVGIAFAQGLWQQPWRWDPKVVFTVLIWLVYAGYLLMRNLRGWGGRWAAWWSVIGMAGLLINYLVVNALSYMHRYGV